MTGTGALLVNCYRGNLKWIEECYRLTGDITARDIANAIGCLLDNISLKELTITTNTDKFEVYTNVHLLPITSKYYFLILKVFPVCLLQGLDLFD